MNRLPQRDEASRMDWIVHISLGLAALAAVVCALGATFDFCTRLDRIAGEFTDSSELVSVPDATRSRALTNAAAPDRSGFDANAAGRTNPPPAACRVPGPPLPG